MKYDFSTFLKQALNEADNPKTEEKPKEKTTEQPKEKKSSIYKNGELLSNDEKEIKNWVSNFKDALSIQNGKIYFNDPSEGEIELKTSKPDLVKNVYNELTSNKGVVKSYSKETFEKLGETYAYRSIVCLASLNDVNDFKEITNDVFENDPDNVLMQINDLPAYFDFAAACTAVTHKLNKEDKESDSAKIANQCKILLTDPTTRFEGIEKTKKEIKEDFTKYHDIFTKAFDDGLKEQHKKMSEKDFKWVDPTTGLPPKGFKGNAAKILGKGIENIKALGDKFADKVKSSPHNLENDMARAAIMGVKLIAAGVHGFGKLFKTFGNKSFTYKNITSKTVDKKIADFNKKYDEAKKGNYLQSQITKDTDEETKKKNENFKRDFQSLMYDELIPMYYKQVQVFSECYLNINDNYILRQTNDGWQTKQIENGNKTELWNAVLLLKEHIEKIDKFFKNKNLYEEFKSSKMELFLGSVEKNKQNLYQDKIKQWFDKIDEENTDKSKIDSLKNVINIYTDDIMLPSLKLESETFAQYKDKLNKSLQALNVIKEIPVVNEFKIKFKEDDSTSEVKGIIPLKQANNENNELKAQFKEISKSLSELKDINDLEKVNSTFSNINDKIKTTMKQMNDMVEQMDDEEKKSKLMELLKNSNTTIDKIIAIKVIMSVFNLTESISLNEIVKLLNEANEYKPNFEGIKTEINDILNDEITLNNVDAMKNKALAIYKNIEEIYKKLNDDAKKKLEKYKGIQLLYAMSSLDNDNQNDNQDNSKTEEAINDTKKSLEFAEDIKEVFTSEYYDKLKGELKTVYNEIEKICDNNDDKLQAFIDVKIDDDIKNDLLPNLWKYKRFLTLISESTNPFYNHDMLILLEDEDNVVDNLTEKARNIKDMMAKDDEPEFNKFYKTWKDEINTLFEKFDKIENKDKLSDPLQKLSAMGNYIQNKPKEKTDVKQEGKPQEGKPQEDKPQEGSKSGETGNKS